MNSHKSKASHGLNTHGFLRKRVIQSLKPMIRELIKAALKEDLGSQGDVTSTAIIPAHSHSSARLIARQNGILCGVEVAMEAFRHLNRKVKMRLRCRDGDHVKPGQTILEIQGNTRALLAAERTALNFIQRLSGIATLTHQFVQQSRSTKSKAQILDTRKTTPLLRALEKYAVTCGGGENHRSGLYDMVLIKDNHLAVLKSCSSNPIREAIRRARKRWPHLKVEVECETLAQVREATKAGVDMILLDNMTPLQLQQAVKEVAGRVKTEASGRVNLDTIFSIARTGVNFISVGALTHSASSQDFSLETQPISCGAPRAKAVVSCEGG